MDNNIDYNAAFKSISAKLKKKFLRKPNIGEAIDEYTSLSRQLENEECYGLSGYCLQQVAKCHHSVGNTVSESGALQQAAKLYLTSEICSSIEIGSLTLDEDLMSAISLYEDAIRLHCDQNEKLLAGKLCLELADIMGKKFDRYFEALPYYERAITLLSSSHPNSSNTITNLDQVLLVQCKLAALQVNTCDFSGALDTYTDICNSILKVCQKSPTIEEPNANIEYDEPLGIYSKLLVESDITKLLLLLYLKPTKLKAEHSNTLEVYSWFQTLSNPNLNYMPVVCMDKDKFILLQSFVMACQSNDAEILYTLQTELWTVLSMIQNYLVDLITQQLLTSSYTDEMLRDDS